MPELGQRAPASRRGEPRGTEPFRARCSRPVDAASLAVFRMVFGAVGVLSAVRIVAYGWVDALYAGPARHFHYLGFDWVGAPGPIGTHLLVATMGLSAAAVALGWRYRVAIVVFWLSFTWIELIDVTTYLNHYWFLSVAGLLMVVLPMAATWSIDARRQGATSVPIGAVWILRVQVAVVYGFAGLAKISADWLVAAEPLRLWLPARADLPVVGPWLAAPVTAVAASWAGAIFDGAVVPLLLWRRTRPWAWLAVVAFHVSTWVLFPIGVFPWLMIGATTVFFAPEWPRRIVDRVRPPLAPSPADRPGPRPARTGSVGRAWVVVAVVWVVVQLALPLRHHLYPGDARWTGEGYRFAWNVLRTEKAGSVSFRVTDVATGRTATSSGADLYTALQLRVMATEPELIRQAAHAIAEDHRARGVIVEVRAEAYLSLNGHAAALLIDPTVDLAAEPARLTPQPWILPAPADDAARS